MSGLSEVSILFGKHAPDIEKAREIFTAEIRAFVSGVLGGVRRVRQDPWTTPRARVDVPREIETEAKATGYLSSQFATARANLRFKRGTNFMVIAEVRFGIEYDEAADAFAWQVVLVPAARYQKLDDVVWTHWRAKGNGSGLPGAVHHDRANTVRFVSRAIGPELTPEVAFNDVKAALEFLLSIDGAIGESVGIEVTVNEEALPGLA